MHIVHLQQFTKTVVVKSIDISSHSKDDRYIKVLYK